MVASGCLPACPIEGQCPNHSRSVNGCLRLSPLRVSVQITRDQSMVASGCFSAYPIEGQGPQSLEISQWLPQAVSLHALLRASVHNHSRSVNGCLRLFPCMPVSTITRDQSMAASGCLPACPIEGQCPQSLEISQWLPQAVSLHAPLRARVQNHSRSVNGCLRLSSCMPY